MAGAALPSTEMVAAAAELGCSLRPGFRFHPTDQELVGWFLRSKVLGHGGLHIHFIPEVNVCGFEPHELPAKSFSPSTCDPGAKVEWYFFAPRCRKYPTGFRMERATENGFWKSTGKDRPIMHNGTIIDMKKTLVFHIGRAPSGTRTDWAMHEYRLHGHRNHEIQDTYTLCRVFKKNAVSPSTDASGGADADEDTIQFVPGAVDTNKDLMEHVSGGANSGKDLMESMPGGVGTNEDPIHVGSESDGAADNVDKDLMQSVLSGGGTDKDPIQIDSDSDGADADKDLMQSMLGGGGTDKDPIQIDSDSDGADVDKDLMQFLLDDIGPDKDPILVESEFDGVYANKGKKQIFVPIGADANKDGTQFVHVGAEANKEGMLPVTSGADVDEDNSDNTWHTDALTEECNSWMQFRSDDDWYTRVDVGKDDSLMQFIFSDVWLLGAD